ncbi:MAG: thiaminase II [Pseudoruegeria sp.]
MNAHPYGMAFPRWRGNASEIWEAYTRHDFVEGLRDGTLPQKKFLHYLRQDYVFLIHFARAWALAVAKSETLSEMKTAATTVDGLVNHELQLHVETCAAAGISEADLFATAEEPENLAYTRYVLEAGYSGDFLDLMAALAPCVLGYGEIGTRLGQDRKSNAYGPWIETYAGSEYQEICATVGHMVDSALVQRLGHDFSNAPKWATLCHRFKTATALEVGFWNMGLRGA